MELHVRLVHAEAGHRVVEVRAAQGERSLGSALAEAATAQDAEDLAIARLLQRLQTTPAGPLSPDFTRVNGNARPGATETFTTSTPSIPLSEVASHADATPSPERRRHQTPPPQADLPLTAPPVVSAPVNRRQAAPIRPSPDKAALPERPPSPHGAIAGGLTRGGAAAPELTDPDFFQPAPASHASPQAARPEEASDQSQPGPSPLPQSDPEEDPPADPEDWSQELAALELNLRRLGWGRQEEGAYLQRAFGHPSRSRLTRYNDLRAYLLALEGLERGSDPAVAAVPLRRSELLAQGDGLLARLGWSADQGRAFLERELQRVSRRQLSDVQLLQFNMLLEGELLHAEGSDAAQSSAPAATQSSDPVTVTPVAALNAPASAAAAPLAVPVEAQR